MERRIGACASFDLHLPQICSRNFIRSRKIRYHVVAVTRQEGLTDHKYSELLTKARRYTLHPPSGQLNGRAGRRATLEDAERILWRCIYFRPHAVPARLLLMRNLVLQNRGREKEVPNLVMRALQETVLEGCRPHSTHAKEALEALELGLTALHKAGRDTGDLHRFLDTALEHAPELRQSAVAMAHSLHFLEPKTPLASTDDEGPNC